MRFAGLSGCRLVALCFVATLAIRAVADQPQPWYPVSNPVWRVAPRHKPFFIQLPMDFRVVQNADGTKLQKSAGLGGSVYHACLDIPLQIDQQIRIVYSLTKRGGGGTPVPYFGVRNDQGLEHVLFLFGSYPKPEEIHEIVVQRHADGLRAQRGERVVDEPTVDRNFGEITDPIFLFFHMNDVSEVFIREVATSVPLDTQPEVAASDDASASQAAERLRCRSRRTPIGWRVRR